MEGIRINKCGKIPT